MPFQALFSLFVVLSTEPDINKSRLLHFENGYCVRACALQSKRWVSVCLFYYCCTAVSIGFVFWRCKLYTHLQTWCSLNLCSIFFASLLRACVLRHGIVILKYFLVRCSYHLFHYCVEHKRWKPNRKNSERASGKNPPEQQWQSFRPIVCDHEYNAQLKVIFSSRVRCRCRQKRARKTKSICLTFIFSMLCVCRTRFFSSLRFSFASIAFRSIFVWHRQNEAEKRIQLF